VKLRQAPDTFGRQTTWKVVSALSGMLGALITRTLLRKIWDAVRADDEGGPVLDPADRRFSWKNAVLWAATAGFALSLARLVSTRLAVAGWEAATGTLPPGVEEPVEI
jgi:hypothetical protein